MLEATSQKTPTGKLVTNDAPPETEGPGFLAAGFKFRVSSHVGRQPDTVTDRSRRHKSAAANMMNGLVLNCELVFRGVLPIGVS
jgi:hypothetical protein